MEYKFEIPTKEDFAEMAIEAKLNKTLLGLPVNRYDVVQGDIRPYVKFFENIVHGGSIFRNSVMLSISGYDTDTRELFEINEVRHFIQKLVNRVPHLFYFIHFDECFSWVIGSYAEKVSTARPIDRKPMDAIEASYRRFELGENIGMPVSVQLSEEKLKKITNSIKLVGAKVKDSEYPVELVEKINSTFK